MSKTEQILSIFLASPGDVREERERVGLFVSEWNDVWAEELGISLRLVRWETHAYPAVGVDGQDVINTQLGEDYDVFLGIMWKRFGTPTGRAASGTVEEFERALARRRRSANPELMFYFKRINQEPGDDASQLQAVQQFREKLGREDGLLYWDFLSPEQFGQSVRIHLTRHIQRWAKRNRPRLSVTREVADKLVGRFKTYLQASIRQSARLKSVIDEFAQSQLEYLTSRSEWMSKIRAMTDAQLTFEFKTQSMKEMEQVMAIYADAAERFEVNFNTEFSSFVENVLGAAAVSTACPDVKAKPLVLLLVELRGKLRPAYKVMGEFVGQLEKLTPTLIGNMVALNQRTTAALSQFHENLGFGDRMLLEAEKLFGKKRK